MRHRALFLSLLLSFVGGFPAPSAAQASAPASAGATVSSATTAEGEGWLTNYADAKKQAKEQNKRLVMLFTGSDWCPDCKLWNKEVFSQAPFKEYAKTNLVLLLVDFPEKKPLPKSQQRANEALQDKYNIERYPTVIVLDSKAKKLGSFLYTEGGFDAFRAKLEAIK